LEAGDGEKQVKRTLHTWSARLLPLAWIPLIVLLGRYAIPPRKTPHFVKEEVARPSPESTKKSEPEAPAVKKPAAVVKHLDFGRDIRPILSDYCYPCHGPSKAGRKADLRLDRREDVLGDASSGKPIVKPGHPSDSELIDRIFSSASNRMPPARFPKKLTDDKRELLKQWIAEGAEYRLHWAYTGITRPKLPDSTRSNQARNPIDRFILARLDREKLGPAPEADRRTLIRRVTLDLLGLPPTVEEVEAFVGDSSGDAYEKVVDRLLASPRYGERQALAWLDLARYGDTNGEHIDDAREMWPWRDWVIQAFNSNKSFADFTIEQLAGDLLPDATDQTQIATGFHRNPIVQREPTDAEVANFTMVDRVNTSGTVWLGSSLACAQCHDHKYDPITLEDYYRVYAVFNNISPVRRAKSDGRGNQYPVLQLPTPAQKVKVDALHERKKHLKELLARKLKEAAASRADRAPICAGLRVLLVILSLQDKIVHFHESQQALGKEVVSTMIMKESAWPIATHVLHRGSLTQKGKQVTPGTPAFLPAIPDGARVDRLSFARWLFGRDNPLTARVTVNRLWQEHFGRGIVKTSEEFGSRGELPTHPELLDWLATELRDSGWDLKAIHRLIVTSKTYRQSSRATPEQHAADPENQWYARGPRCRLPAEIIRDNALAISGLLDQRIGGPSVTPYQPPGLWEAIRHPSAATAMEYVQSHGQDLYRRGMYTFWKRALPHPSLTAFDAPSREVCLDRRPRTNTALQALVLLNDPIYVECARRLAQRIMREGGANFEQRLSYAMALCVCRPPSLAELRTLYSTFEQEMNRFQKDPAAVSQILAVGESPVEPQFDRAELAAWSALANALLNLDETITLE
jgi:hypothetical protein